MLKIKPTHVSFTHQLANSARQPPSKLMIYALEVRTSKDTVMFPSLDFDKGLALLMDFICEQIIPSINRNPGFANPMICF